VALLAGTAYDPGTATTASTATLQAMTAIDTTNLRLTFTAPANGIVLVRLRTVMHGATTSGQVLLGVLDGATVRGRQAPIPANRISTGNAAIQIALESSFLVTGLTPSTSYTWDAAYGVEFAVASSGLKYGGPNDTTANNAFGAFTYEIWETQNLLAGKNYDPGTAVTNKALTPASVMTAFDTTNLRLTFTAPASGKVLVRIRVMGDGAANLPYFLLGVLDGATVRARQTAGGMIADSGAVAATTHLVWEALMLVTGLTASTSYTWDAAWAVEVIAATTALKYGGPDNATQDDAYGGLAYEIWTA
jgi:hypothetical protein